ncbi:hypothetical protein DNTS_000627 [Danionella cerebrum]|uniref:Leucine-rich repeat-containing protein 41 n=1 Tax=Danionella cerebrum TaxID=2873325 RepID=A0A553RKE1_9TELE|nr:hypothetical protein DNTS_000627 [Danionella translucida]
MRIVNSLLQMSIVKVAQNMDVLERKVSNLPISLLKDLLQHLNIYYLDRIETAVASKGISTSVIWERIWRELDKTWRCRAKSLVSEPNWKQRCLERLFHMLFFSHLKPQSSYLSNISKSSLLSLSAKHVRVLSLHTSAKSIIRLASPELHPVLRALEAGVTSIKILDSSSPFRLGDKFMFILHRLLDHGSVKEVVLRRNPDNSSLLNWLASKRIGLQGCVVSTGKEVPQNDVCVLGSASDPDEPATKRRLLDSRSKEVLRYENPTSSEVFYTDVSSERCGIWSPRMGCPSGQIQVLDLEVHSSEMLFVFCRILPSWLCLQALHLHFECFLGEHEVSMFVECLRQLCTTPGCSLRHLSLPYFSFHETIILDALSVCVTLQSLTADVCVDGNIHRKESTLIQNKVLCLENLSISGSSPVSIHCYLPALRESPRLLTLQLTKTCLTPGFFQTLTESNPLLKVLKLDDIKLSDHLPKIVQFLENCTLEELCLKDCRLLESCSVKKEVMLSLVSALKRVSSLRILTLTRNRLASSVVEMAELFSGSPPSKISMLDLSANFISAADLLKFAKRLETLRPMQPITLDLGFNPLDRDPEIKSQALRTLHPFCKVVMYEWDSRKTMVDHISVM